MPETVTGERGSEGAWGSNAPQRVNEVETFGIEIIPHSDEELEPIKARQPAGSRAH